MENKILSVKDRNNRKMMLALPLLVLPFITILFWLLGGGKGKETALSADKKPGFNMLLPNPKLKEDSSLDKMSYYDKASSDSLKLEELKKKDPNYSISKADDSNLEFGGSFESDVTSMTSQNGGLNKGFLKPENEQRMYQKLQALQKAIAEPPTVNGHDQDMREFQYQKPPYGESAEMKNLEQLMAAMNAPSEPDPELAQLGGMLENILDIQYPERVQEKLRKNSRDRQKNVYSVSMDKKNENSSLLQPSLNLSSQPAENRFYSFEDEKNTDSGQNALPAVVHETQTLTSGSIVKIRLTGDISLNGVPVPRNTFVFGTASLKGERLEIKIEAVRYQNSILPVELQVYDLDGIKGICIPGNIDRDVAKASADRSMQSIGLSGVSDSWGAQAAGMGVEAAKSLLSKKVKLVKVAVKAGYRVLLYDEKQKYDN